MSYLSLLCLVVHVSGNLRRGWASKFGHCILKIQKR